MALRLATFAALALLLSVGNCSPAQGRVTIKTDRDGSIDLPAVRLDGAHIDYGRPPNGVIDAKIGNDKVTIKTGTRDGGAKSGKPGP